MRKQSDVELKDLNISHAYSQNLPTANNDLKGNPATLKSYKSQAIHDSSNHPNRITENPSFVLSTINGNENIEDFSTRHEMILTDLSDNLDDPLYETDSNRHLNQTTIETNSKPQFEKDAQDLKQRKSHQSRMTFHWFIGVFIPVFLNLICVTYFMDLHRSIEHIGWGLGFLFYTVSMVVSIGTLISICVIATNGEMQDGGCYYLLSRTLGPEIGGAIGITLIIAHGTALSHRLHYLSAAICQLYSGYITGSERWDRTIMHIILSVVVLLLCLPGTKFVMYTLPFLAIILVLAVISIYLGFFFKKPGNPSFFTGLSLKTLTENFSPQYYSGWEYLQFLGFLFPSANAVMTCANFSGNLRPVGRAIPIGGFMAMFISAFIISSTFLLMAASFDLKNSPESQSNWVYGFIQSSKQKIKSTISKAKGLSYLSFDASLVPILTAIGFIAGCLGSAITLSMGGARIMAKMIDDKLLPSKFKMLFFRGEPFSCNIVIALIGIICAMIDNPTKSTQLTNIIYSIPFCLVNFSVWTAASAHYPGFRPSFRFFNKWTALLLAVICFARMFLMNWIMALISLPVYLIIWFIYHKLQPPDTYGTVTQSRILYSTLKEELNLYHIKPHVKTYRPNIILISTKHPNDERDYIDFLNQILHGHGMAAIGRVFISSQSIDFAQLVDERDGTYLTDEAGYQTFYDVTVAETFAEGVRDLLLLMGIGMMRPNTICLMFPEGWHEETLPQSETNGYDYKDFVNAIAMAFDANFSLTVLRNIEYYSQVDRKGTIDVWWIVDDGGLSLLLPYLLSNHKTWRKSKIRLITIANTDEGNNLETQEQKMATLLYKFRIDAEPIVIEISMSNEVPTPMAQTQWNNMASKMKFNVDPLSDPVTHRSLVISDLVREYSSGASFVALTMMVPNESVDPKIFMAWLDILSEIKVPFCLIRGNGENTLSWAV